MGYCCQTLDFGQGEHMLWSSCLSVDDGVEVAFAKALLTFWFCSCLMVFSSFLLESLSTSVMGFHEDFNSWVWEVPSWHSWKMLKSCECSEIRRKMPVFMLNVKFYGTCLIFWSTWCWQCCNEQNIWTLLPQACPAFVCWQQIPFMYLVFRSGWSIDFFAETVRVPAGLVASWCGHLYDTQRGEISRRLFKNYPLTTIWTLFKPVLIQDIFSFLPLSFN